MVVDMIVGNQRSSVWRIRTLHTPSSSFVPTGLSSHKIQGDAVHAADAVYVAQQLRMKAHSECHDGKRILPPSVVPRLCSALRFKRFVYSRCMITPGVVQGAQSDGPPTGICT